ncbi:MAG TPA: periplasmic heavy metal sensor [Candidatus Kryptobacter bacterium]|nr:periplasmic heavy metal sensor [Candidatus Kryptobacter bacterium]
MNKKTIYYTALVLTFINLGALGTVLYYRVAGGNISPLTESRNQRFEEVRHALDLSRQQISKFEVSRSIFYARTDSLSTVLVRERTELANELWQTPTDTLRVNGLVDSIGQVQSAAQRAIIAHLLEVKEVLTLDQQEKLHSIVLRRFESSQPIPGQH